MAHLTFVLGGVRSGKSRFAEGLARPHAPRVYLATALVRREVGEPADEAFAARIRAHQDRRAAGGWVTVEEPWDIGGALQRSDGPPETEPPGCVLVECMTLWVTNLMLGLPGRDPLPDPAIAAAVDGFLGRVRAGRGRVIVVSNEVGYGLMPANELSRRFGDRLGEANQHVAAAADEVYACLAGIPLKLR